MCIRDRDNSEEFRSVGINDFPVILASENHQTFQVVACSPGAVVGANDQAQFPVLVVTEGTTATDEEFVVHQPQLASRLLAALHENDPGKPLVLPMVIAVNAIQQLVELRKGGLAGEGEIKLADIQFAASTARSECLDCQLVCFRQSSIAWV